MKSPSPKPYLAHVTPYIGGKSKVEGHTSVIKLSSNENAYGPSPRALAAYQSAAASLHRYPEDGCYSLREAIAKRHGLDAARILCGAGSDEVIGMIVHTYAGTGDEVLFTEHSFLMYRVYTEQFGATAVAAKETGLRTDVDTLLAAVTPRTRILFLANPNNPTGSYIPKTELARLRAGLREDILLVIDGAYHEFVEAKDYSDGLELVEAGTNTLITRTFSKIYGLPALRIGWGYGPAEIMQTLYKVREPFNVAQPGLAAAIAALEDADYTRQCVKSNTQHRHWLQQEITSLELKPYPSQANFLLVKFPNTKRRTAPGANAFLLSQGIIVRDVANYGLPDCLRITIGTEAENQALVVALKEFMAS